MLVTAAFCPASPLLVPRVSAGAAAELDDLRAATHEAITALLASGLDALAVIASGPSRAWPPAPDSFARLGLDEPAADNRPLALQVAAALLGEHAWRGETRWQTADDRGDAEALAHPGRMGVLCLGDGSARRSTAAPGYLDPDAEPYDELVAAALGGADLEALLSLEAADDDRLLVDGRRAWQLLARGFAEQPGARPSGQLLASAAPYGVGLFVARWWA